MTIETYDVVVVGGGAAGLSGALVLGRARRSVLVVDAGEPRNAPAGQVHGYLGHEGTPPAELLAGGREEVARYGVRVEQGTVDGAAAVEQGFDVQVGGRAVRARRLLLATGLVDVLPDLPGVAEGWGGSVLHCPYCHGWEVRDTALAVLATSPLSLHQALLFRQWTDDLVLLQHTAPPLSEEQAEQLAARGVRVVEGRVVAWEPGGARLENGELVQRTSLVVAPSFATRTPLLQQLGVPVRELEMGGVVVGTHADADARGRTPVPGVWVAGNAADLGAQVVAAAAAGLTAAAGINADLVEEDTALAVRRARLLTEQAWDERYEKGHAGGWTGEPNAVLVQEASALPPARALDVGCGEGGDALWLAARGWQVTGSDLSSVALDKAASAARERGLDVTWQHADARTEAPEAGAYDLVTASFLHPAADARRALHRRLADAVAPGGHLLLVAHAPSHVHTASGEPALRELFVTPEQVVDDLDPTAFEVLVAEERPRLQAGHGDGPVQVSDVVVHARRRA
ncbi:MAG: SAM-dependent methyltransferase [Frankiales bacterium]|nr:SAM-dependent methyltransferase [Frankiales bacterium]